MLARTARFVICQVVTGTFWRLFLASFTLVMMATWRTSLRDEIFQSAAKSVGRKIIYR